MLFIMKRFCFTFLVLIVFTAGLKAVGTKTIDVCFIEEQFAFYTNPLGVIEIISKANNVTLESDTTQPGLPFVPINIKVPLGTKPNVVNEKISKRLLLTDVVISTNPVTVPTNAVIEPSTQSVPTYGKKHIHQMRLNLLQQVTEMDTLCCGSLYALSFMMLWKRTCIL